MNYIKYVVVVFVLSIVAGFAAHHRLELNKEYPKLGEEREFQKFANSIRKLQRKANDGDIRRGFHAKHHGCLTGTFKVLETRVAREGVFKEAKEFPLWVRFSNAGGKIQEDSAPDLRGVALKLMNVDGKKLLPNEQDAKTQDFLMTNKPVATKDAKSFVEFAEAAAEGPVSLLGWTIWHPVTAWSILGKALEEVPSLLTEQYWSGAPILIGSRAAKFNITPCRKIEKVMPEDPSENYLKEDLTKDAKRNSGICFNFNVQYQTDPYATPIEDTLDEWTEGESPSFLVAKVLLPRQSFDSPAQNEFCENLAFTPWHALPDHRPLGNVMRARRVIYEASRSFRRGGKPSVEPSPP